MKVLTEIKNRWSGKVLFSAEVEGETFSIRLGLVVRLAIKAANLTRADLTAADLTAADLTDANLTRADLTAADLTNANLTDANLTRADLTDADLTAADLTNANLTDANLTNANLTDANLTRADLTDADLTDANLTRADLTRADLTAANLTRANLTAADLTRANGLPIAPVVENIDAAILASIEVGGQLEMNAWHTCETTHCRAGWACRLAGYAGGILEGQTSAYLAGRLIYEASRPGIPAPNFFANNEEAMRDLKESAAKYSK